MNSILVRGGGFLAALLAGALALAVTPTGSAAPKNNKNKPATPAPLIATTYSGRATALNIEGVRRPNPGDIVLADTGELPTNGGTLAASDSDYLLMGDDGVTVALGVELAQASAFGGGSEATADSSLTGFQVTFENFDHERVTITADHISASARASISASGRVTADWSSSFSNLRIDGVPFVVTGESNQTIEVKGMRVVFNEETAVSAEGQADIKLTAIHFYVCDCMNGAFGVVYAGLTAGSNPPPAESECGKLTGGGWIASPAGAKGTFAVSGGIRRGEYWGHLQYNDHGASLQVKSTRVTGFTEKPGDANARVITYEVQINGLPGTATVEVADRGEPGRDDEFFIRLSTGYAAGGSLGGDDSGGGNIQLHKCPPGWAK